jgi:hydrophobic/amphiphilic exporter-1 (mainly G- bacteria), HAE1 family
MDIIGLAVRRPMAVAAAVILIVTFGLVAMRTIPIQLTPDVNRPILQVRTVWPGAAPAEVEREVTNRLETELAGIEGMVESASRTYAGLSIIVLEFDVNQNMDRAFMLISNRLSNLSGLPAEAGKPLIRTSSSDDVPIARMALTARDGNERPIETYGDFAERVVVDRLERVSGVSQVGFAGGSFRVLEVVISPTDMARYRLTVPNVTQAIRSSDISLTAGAVDEGKRRYVVRTDSDTSTIEDLRAVVVHTQIGENGKAPKTVTLGDVASVQFGYSEPRSRRRFNGRPMLRFNVVRESGANVMRTMQGLSSAVDALNAGPLAREGLSLRVYYNETVYIRSAIDLVQQNIYVGGTLAALVLLLFLRSIRATAVVALAIPVSVISTFVALSFVGRSINVISLAGIAFAVGMVVDAAIVVLENIFRLRSEGLDAAESARRGTRQVWSAIFASAATTIVVFVPILTLNLTAGQLFRDIAVAISVSVLLSLIVAVTVIPTLASRLLATEALGEGKRLQLPGIDWAARLFARGMLALVNVVSANVPLAIGLVIVVCTATITSTIAWAPSLDYLPDGNRNFVIGRIQPPPGYNLSETYRVAQGIESRLSPLWSEDHSEATDDRPAIDSFFFIAWRNFTLIGASAKDIARADELVPALRDAASGEPDSRVFVSQSSIFGRRLGGSKVINLNISGTDLDKILEVAREANERVKKALPRKLGGQVRARPGLDLAAPEVRITPDQRRLAHVGLSARDFAQTIDVLNEGMRVQEVTVGSRRIDLILRGPVQTVRETQGIAQLPIVTRQGIVRAGALADISISAGPTEIRHIERQRAVTLQIRPPSKMPLEEAVNIVRSEVMVPLREAGLPESIKLELSGAAGDLARTWKALQLNLLVAVVVVYLVLAVLFESIVLPLIILLSVPLATAGGVWALALLNIYVDQPLDMLTMLGFVILIGIVVNNAILLVDRTLVLHREGMAPRLAIHEATQNRLRPIFMSTLTSVFGLLPLVLFPGAGSELYRGLGSVVVGGLTVSAILTLAIIPPLLAVLLPTMAKPSISGRPSSGDISAPAD